MHDREHRETLDILVYPIAWLIWKWMQAAERRELEWAEKEDMARIRWAKAVQESNED